jgi:hypothetical protein
MDVHDARNSISNAGTSCGGFFFVDVLSLGGFGEFEGLIAGDPSFDAAGDAAVDFFVARSCTGLFDFTAIYAGGNSLEKYKLIN